MENGAGSLFQRIFGCKKWASIQPRTSPPKYLTKALCVFNDNGLITELQPRITSSSALRRKATRNRVRTKDVIGRVIGLPAPRGRSDVTNEGCPRAWERLLRLQAHFPLLLHAPIFFRTRVKEVQLASKEAQIVFADILN